jgi:hypothetical protein
MKKTVLVLIVSVVGAVAAVSGIRYLVLDGHPPQTPGQDSTSDAIKKEVEEEVIDPADPEFNIDDEYSIGEVKYFDNETWAVAELVPKDPNLYQRGWIVLRKQGDVYNTIVGPGTYFPNESLAGAPLELLDFLYTKGLAGE